MFALLLSLSMIAGCSATDGTGDPAVVADVTGRATTQPEPVMSEDHMEAILLWSSAESAAAAEQWLAAQGFETMPMRAGLLVTGERKTFERAFGVRLAGRELPLTLPVPAALQGVVDTISIRRPPDYR